MEKSKKYCDSLTKFMRRATCPVAVGEITIGGDAPVVVQSMATTDTNDVENSVLQAERIAAAGGQIVRFTAQGRREAESLAVIRTRLRERGSRVPLVADIHFNPNAALIAAANVEKVRINPGNFVDKRADFSHIEYTDQQYAEELNRLEQRLCELITVCKANGTALRLGVNHGSLSDRIMSRYGDTPAGMVESAMEFLRVCRKQNFDQVVLSMKSSNTQVMVYAYRLLVASMRSQQMDYPLHLGVTEAGEGEDGRIKSAVGIGALLADGIGDTIRVSLTEPPENEIPVAEELVNYFSQRAWHQPIAAVDEAFYEPYQYNKRRTKAVGIVGGEAVPVVVLDVGGQEICEELLLQIARQETPPDFIYVGERKERFAQAEALGLRLIDGSDICRAAEFVVGFAATCQKEKRLEGAVYVECLSSDLTPEFVAALKACEQAVLILRTENSNGVADQRAFFLRLLQEGVTNPVIIKRNYCERSAQSLQLRAAADFGMLFIDGFGDGIWIENKNEPGVKGACDRGVTGVGGVSLDRETTGVNSVAEAVRLLDLSFGILQATRVRISKTEYISCPGCGRTLFDLQQTVRRVRERTSHLKGLKIAVMGCIVNGPGEMADANYGYVGSGAGLVTLYRNKEVVQRNIPQCEAIDRLVNLIKMSGDWR